MEQTRPAQAIIVKELKKYYIVGSPCRTLLYCLRLAALYYFFTSPTIERHCLTTEWQAAQSYYRLEDKQRFLTARLLCREIAAPHINHPAQHLSIHKNKQGAPFLTLNAYQHQPLLPNISISHSGDYVAIALAWHIALGIDLEYETHCDFAQFNEIALQPHEYCKLTAYSRAQFWTAKEAASKAWGTGLQINPLAIQVCPLSEHRFTAYTASYPIAFGRWLQTNTATIALALVMLEEQQNISAQEWHFY